MRITLWLLSLVASLVISCSPGKDRKSINENRVITVDDIRKQKPTYPELTPTQYNIGFHEPTYIRVVTNSTRLQEVWMVYYDLDAKKWEPHVPMGEGRGENNTIIGDHKFEKRYGFGNPNQDVPEFYSRYWDDGEQTWRGHKIEKAFLSCDARGKDLKINWEAHLLVSLPLNPQTNLPDVAILLQWGARRHWSGPAALSEGFKNLCGVLREVPLEVKQ